MIVLWFLDVIIVYYGYKKFVIKNFIKVSILKI